MQGRRVLIVEDDPILALDLQVILEEATDGAAEVLLASSVDAARRALAGPGLDAVLLDVDVRDGKTFGLAALLRAQGTPFAFVSGSRRDEVPAALRDAPFLPKPYEPGEVERVVLAALSSPAATAPQPG
jgi:DNA-binding response OmpR family regulator